MVRDFFVRGSARRSRARRVTAAAAVMVAAALAVGCSSGSGSSSAASAASGGSGGKVTPDVAFFKGKTITYIVPNTPGSPPGLIMTAMKPGLEKYLGATINIEYNTNVATVGEDIVGASAPTGLTLGNLTPLVVLNEVYASSGAPDFSLTDASWIGATRTAPILVAGCKTTEFSSYAQLIQDKAAIKAVNIPTGATNEVTRLLMQIFPTSHQYLNGYTATTAIVGCQRGDGNYAALGVSKALDVAGTAAIPGVTPLLLSSPMPSASPSSFLNSQVPTIATLAKQFPPTTSMGKTALQIANETFNTDTPYYATFGPPGIPAARVLALTDAFAAVSKTAAVQQAALAAGVYPGFVSASTLASFFKTELAQKSAVEQILNSN